MKTLGVLILFLESIVVCRTNKTWNPPHIIIMIADDLGWSDVSFHGSKQIPTPNIDVIAQDGIILNQHYVQPLCSPSRAALLTAKYPIRTGLQNYVIEADSPWGLPLQEKILPEYLKSLQYSTHAVGKWHLGFFKEEYLPNNRGFDTFFGYYTGVKDYYTHVAIESGMEGLDLHQNGKPVWKYNGTYGTELFTKKAVQVIRKHDPKRPLFLYFAQQAPHSGNFDTYPLQVPRKYLKNVVNIKDKKRRKSAAMISALDESVGEIFAALDKSQMLDNIIFIFLSDNGGTVQGMNDGVRGSNFPLRGGKYTLWEGGIRSIAFIWSPFLRHVSRVHNGLMHVVDWMPTILSAAGGARNLDTLREQADGVDQWPTLARLQPPPRTEILLNINDVEGVSGIRRGKFKLLTGSKNPPEYDQWYDIEGKLIHRSAPKMRFGTIMSYHKNYLRLWVRSKAVHVLHHKYGTDILPSLILRTSFDCEPLCENSVLVRCDFHSRPRSDSSSAQTSFLFDLANDPCEFDNLVDTLPHVAAELESAIDKYRKFMIPPGDKPKDPRANPALHGNAWQPWM